MRTYEGCAGVDHFGNPINGGHTIAIPRYAPQLHNWNWRISQDGKGWRVVFARENSHHSTAFSPVLMAKRDAVAYAVAYYGLDTVQVCNLVNGKTIIATHLMGEKISFEEIK
jgi:glutamine cyclotransferase